MPAEIPENPLTDTAPVTQGKTRRFPRWLLFFFALGALLVMTGIVAWAWYQIDRQIALSEFHLAIEQLQESGVPTDNKSLQKLYEGSTSHVHADDWVMLGETVQSKGLHYELAELPVANDDPAMEPECVPPPGVEWTNREEVEKALENWNEELQTLIRLGKLQRSEPLPLFRPIFFDSVDTLVPGAQNARFLIQLPRLAHRVAVYDGDQERAVELIQSAQDLERSMMGEPVIISQLVRIAIAADVTSLEPHLANEYVKGRGHDGIYYIEKMQALIDLPDTSMMEFRQAAQEIERSISRDFEQKGTLWTTNRMISATIIPASEAYTSAIVRQCERNRLAQLAMAIRRFEHQHNHWPNSLDELTSLGVDLEALHPATVNPFNFRILANGDAIVWGIPDTSKHHIPSEPPPTDFDQHEDNIGWVWRLRRQSAEGRQ